MRQLLQEMVLFLALGLILLLTACGSGAAEAPPTPEVVDVPKTGSVELALLGAPDPAAPAPTPVPSGFVPGDALPTPVAVEATPPPIGEVDENGYRELTWEALVPIGFRAEDIMSRYQGELGAMQDGDPAAMDVYEQMMDEFNNAPINEDLDQLDIRLPGFIAPLEFKDGLITTFLLVPYFGACIHVPPPPNNQTVFVTLAEGNGIIPGDSYYPFWVQGKMLAEGEETDIGTAGYAIADAVVEPYIYGP